MRNTWVPLLLGLGAAFAAPACSSVSKTSGGSSASATAAGDRRIPSGAQTVLASSADPRVGTYVSSENGFETSSYWIEGPDGLILIDTQFLLSAGKEAVDWAEQATGKKVKLAIVLHPNPDKFNGTLQLRARGIPVVTSEQVRALIPAVHKLRTGWFYERFKPDYPAELPLPDSFGSATKELSAGGVTVRAHVLGAGCSGAHVVVEWEGHVFTGDLVTHGLHSWLELGLLDEWLKRIQEIRAMKPRWVHPGRGPSGGPELLTQERAYLEKVIQLVDARHPRGKPSEATLGKIAERIQEAYPGYEYRRFVTLGLEEVWKRRAELRARGGRSR